MVRGYYLWQPCLVWGDHLWQPHSVRGTDYGGTIDGMTEHLCQFNELSDHLVAIGVKQSFCMSVGMKIATLGNLGILVTR